MKVAKILRKGNSLIAFNESGESMGRISLLTAKFTGNTDALIPLNERYDTYRYPKKKRVWNVAFLDKNGELIDQTQIDEKRASLAWSLFEEFGHTKEKGMRLEWTPDWEEIKD